jgi:hypothetical protein
MNNIDKHYVTTMPDGSKWAVPVREIAADRAAHYAKEYGGSYSRSLMDDTIPLFNGDSFEIQDWAQINMNWDDVKDCAVMVSAPTADFQEGWMNGDHELVDS